MSAPSVAIVVTTCDYGQYLEECLRSLASQTRPVEELVIVDDASTDDTPEVLRRLRAELPVAASATIVRYVTRQGLARAMNDGIARTKADFVAHVDADDTVEPQYIERLLRALQEHPHVGYAYPRLRLFGAESGLMSSYPFDAARLIFEGNYIPNVALMRRDAFLASGGVRDLPTHLDWDLWLAFLETGWPGVLVDEPLYNWRRHAGAMTYQTAARRLAIRLQIMGRHHRLIASHRRDGPRWMWSAIRRRIRGAATDGSVLSRSGWVDQPPD